MVSLGCVWLPIGKVRISAFEWRIERARARALCADRTRSFAGVQNFASEARCLFRRRATVPVSPTCGPRAGPCRAWPGGAVRGRARPCGAVRGRAEPCEAVRGRQRSGASGATAPYPASWTARGLQSTAFRLPGSKRRAIPLKNGTPVDCKKLLSPCRAAVARLSTVFRSAQGCMVRGVSETLFCIGGWSQECREIARWDVFLEHSHFCDAPSF